MQFNTESPRQLRYIVFEIRVSKTEMKRSSILSFVSVYNK